MNWSNAPRSSSSLFPRQYFEVPFEPFTLDSPPELFRFPKDDLINLGLVIFKDIYQPPTVDELLANYNDLSRDDLYDPNFVDNNCSTLPLLVEDIFKLIHLMINDLNATMTSLLRQREFLEENKKNLVVFSQQANHFNPNLGFINQINVQTLQREVVLVTPEGKKVLAMTMEDSFFAFLDMRIVSICEELSKVYRDQKDLFVLYKVLRAMQKN